MSDLTLKTHYSVKELITFKLSTLPTTHKSILEKAQRENWQSQKRNGRGGGVEYVLSSLPMDVQDEIRTIFTETVLDKPKASLPMVREIDVTSLTEKQRQIADARMALVSYVTELEQALPRYKAVKLFCDKAKYGELPENLMNLVVIANAKRGGSRLVSVRTLNQWVLDYHQSETSEQRLKMLAPAQRLATKAEEITWLSDFLAVYRQTNGVNVTEAYSIFTHLWHTNYADQPLMLKRMPSIDQVRRALAKLPRHIKEIGRKTGAELRALNTYVKRDWSVMKANDVWVGDGHSMKMKVQHPDHGRPFIPELTMVMDAASRFIVGWSVSLAENCIAVADAIRNGVERHGIPAIYYSDNGGGEKNWTLDAEITGILPRLGINHQTGIPGNPQGRGIIERVNQTIALRIARQFETYHGTGADRETVRKTATAVVSLDKALRNNKQELTPKQRWAMGKLPTWQQFIDAVEKGIEWYNHEHIHREIGMTPARKRQQLLTTDEIIYVTPVEARDMFRPQVLRTAQRGWIALFNNDYFSQKLLDVDGEKVTVAFDIHDPSQVIIRKLDGVFVCYAELNGNKREAFPVSFVEKTRKERHKNRMKLKQEQIDEINAELNPIISIEHKESADWLHQIRVQGTPEWTEEAEEIAVFPSELRRKQRKVG